MTVLPDLGRLGRLVLDVLLPEAPRCPGCHREGSRSDPGLCPACLARLPRVAPPLCGQCGRPLRASALPADGQNGEARGLRALLRKRRARGQAGGGGGPGNGSGRGHAKGHDYGIGRGHRRDDSHGHGHGGMLCRRCALEPRLFHVARAPTVYDGAVKDYIHRFKYGGERELGMALGVLLGRCLEREPVLWPVDALVPVPLHPSRLEDRGFNQAEVLARVVGEWVGRPVWADALRRVRKTETQTKLSARERHANVRGAFRPWRAARLAGRRLLLVDDVYTSGATVEEAARVLLKAGAAQVNVLCLAVGVRPAEWLEAG